MKHSLKRNTHNVQMSGLVVSIQLNQMTWREDEKHEQMKGKEKEKKREREVDHLVREMSLEQVTSLFHTNVKHGHIFSAITKFGFELMP